MCRLWVQSAHSILSLLVAAAAVVQVLVQVLVQVVAVQVVCKQGFLHYQQALHTQ
jgi:hypothetical protein